MKGGCYCYVVVVAASLAGFPSPAASPAGRLGPLVVARRYAGSRKIRANGTTAKRPLPSNGSIRD